ncbi:MAG: BamA/TamA family outer membrane protein, partial [Amylibacter sp.]
ARFDRPATFGPNTALFLTAGAELLKEPDFSDDQYGVGVGLSRIISNTATGELALEYRHSQVSDVRGTSNFNLVSLPVTVTWDRRDNALNPRDGFFLFSELRPFAGFGSTSSGIRSFIDGRAYHSLGSKLVLANRVQFGSVLGPGVATAPPDYLFYSGGGGTVRGQSYQSLGIDLGGGLRRGGRSFAGLSTELRVDVTDTIGVVGFVDAGFVGADSFYNGNGGTHGGIGLGLRYNTGIGPIRFDVGAPIGTDSGSAIQVYIGIGQAF